MVFQDNPTVKVTSYLTGSTNTISIDGITAQPFTPETAKSNIDVLLDVIGESVQTNKMKRIRTEEAVNNG